MFVDNCNASKNVQPKQSENAAVGLSHHCATAPDSPAASKTAEPTVPREKITDDLIKIIV